MNYIQKSVALIDGYGAITTYALPSPNYFYNASGSYVNAGAYMQRKEEWGNIFGG